MNLESDSDKDIRNQNASFSMSKCMKIYKTLPLVTNDQLLGHSKLAFRSTKDFLNESIRKADSGTLTLNVFTKFQKDLDVVG